MYALQVGAKAPLPKMLDLSGMSEGSLHNLDERRPHIGYENEPR
jgi:hypothetical protein